MKLSFVVGAALLVCACGEDDPQTNDAGATDQPIIGAACSSPPAFTENVSSCSPLATDYQPRDAMSANDSWAACISDDGVYHKIEDSVSSIARVEAYDTIGMSLWAAGAEPTHADFFDARVLFEEEQGLGSRVARRYDVHYDPPATGACDEEGVAEANPDYCVGPGKLQPIIVDAFADGAMGNNRVVNAAKIRAAIQWFMYVSSVKEGTTCTDKPKDCDSCWAYYSGGTPRDNPIGLAKDIDAYAPETHDRVFDAVLAVRCWRDLDQAIPAADTAMRDQAIAQLDNSLVRGMAILIRQYFARLACSTGDYQTAELEALRILVPLFDRETRSRNTQTADLLMGEVAKNASDIDVTAVLAAIDSTYPCP